MMRPKCHVRWLRFYFKSMLNTGLGQQSLSFSWYWRNNNKERQPYKRQGQFVTTGQRFLTNLSLAKSSFLGNLIRSGLIDGKLKDPYLNGYWLQMEIDIDLNTIRNTFPKSKIIDYILNYLGVLFLLLF